MLRVWCLQTTHERGIVISAGGKYYLPQAIVLLRILRHHLNCTLPVDLFWLDSNEMDDVTYKVGWVVEAARLFTGAV